LAAFFLVVILEMFLPSAGILFVVSLLLAAAAVVTGFMHSLYLGATMVGILVLSMPVLFAFFSYVWPHTPLGRMVMIPAPTPESVLPQSGLENSLETYKGAKGQVLTPMRPTGSVRVGDKAMIASCETGAAEPGQWVRVVRIQMNRLVVVPVEIADDLQAPGGFDQQVEQVVDAALTDFEWEAEPPADGKTP
jgi:membrane-bound ClpP family serine protease